MRTRIKIRTIKGQAEKVEKRIKPYILGNSFNKLKFMEIYINKENNEIAWEVEDSVRKIMKINYNVVRFDVIMKNIFNNKLLRKKLLTKVPKDQVKELESLLRNHTKVTIIKNATAEELVEANKTWWQKIKETFHKVE